MLESELISKKALMVQAQHATDDYTFFRERESPAESSLKNKVIIDLHTGAATGNRILPVAVDVSHSLRALMSVLYFLSTMNLGGTAELFVPFTSFACGRFFYTQN